MKETTTKTVGGAGQTTRIVHRSAAQAIKVAIGRLVSAADAKGVKDLLKANGWLSSSRKPKRPMGSLYSR